MALLIGLNVQFVSSQKTVYLGHGIAHRAKRTIKARKRYTYAMVLLIGLSIQFVSKQKTVYLGHGLLIGLSVQFVLNPENGIPTVGLGIAHRVKRTIRLKARKRYTYCRPWYCSPG